MEHRFDTVCEWKHFFASIKQIFWNYFINSYSYFQHSCQIHMEYKVNKCIYVLTFNNCVLIIQLNPYTNSCTMHNSSLQNVHAVLHSITFLRYIFSKQKSWLFHIICENHNTSAVLICSRFISWWHERVETWQFTVLHKSTILTLLQVIVSSSYLVPR